MIELSTDWSTAMGLTKPIVNAPMGGVAGGALAAAVARAGGLGMVGMGSAGSAAKLTRELHHVSGLQRPFGIGLVGWVADAEPALLDTALQSAPAVVAVSFGQSWEWVRKAHDAGAMAAAQVGDLRSARCAADAGVDVVIARGAEGGGHGEPRIGTLPLLAAVLDHLSLPVLAAGGVSTGRALAAVLGAGASGAWVGTALTTCTEASTTPAARAALIAAEDIDTVTTRVFDIASGYPWPESLPERVLRNTFYERWMAHEAEIDSMASDVLANAVGAEDYSTAPVNAGQGVGMLADSRPAADVMDQMCAEAATLLRRWSSLG